MDNGFILSVSRLNRYVKSILEQDVNLRTVLVKGEISNLTAHYKTGHYYMTLKDEKAAIRAVMFRSDAERLTFTPENSASVLARGRVGLFERDGQYQLYIDDMRPYGESEANAAFERLKKKLAAEGLFDSERKKTVPVRPSRVGVVTSPTGAAIRDIINVISRRFPLTEIIFCPVTVQGDSAAPEIAAAIRLFNARKAADVIVVGRGGGSAEDLRAFNDETPARAAAESEIPIISAVGHETDFTIFDFAADLRAPTPSAAAELAVPDAAAELRNVRGAVGRMNRALAEAVATREARLKTLEVELSRSNPSERVLALQLRRDEASSAMESAVRYGLALKSKKFSELCARLDAMSPLKILSRGFGIAARSGEIITDARRVEVGDEIDLRLARGALECEVKKIKGC